MVPSPAPTINNLHHITTPFATEFFREECLWELGGYSNHEIHKVDKYLKLWVTGLSVPSVLFSSLQELGTFGILQTGGVPNPRTKDGKSFTYTGFTTYFIWMAFLFGLITTTLASLITTVLSYARFENRYRECMVEVWPGSAYLNVTLPLLVLHP